MSDANEQLERRRQLRRRAAEILGAPTEGLVHFTAYNYGVFEAVLVYATTTEQRLAIRELYGSPDFGDDIEVPGFPRRITDAVELRRGDLVQDHSWHYWLVREVVGPRVTLRSVEDPAKGQTVDIDADIRCRLRLHAATTDEVTRFWRLHPPLRIVEEPAGSEPNTTTLERLFERPNAWLIDEDGGWWECLQWGGGSALIQEVDGPVIPRSYRLDAADLRRRFRGLSSWSRRSSPLE